MLDIEAIKARAMLIRDVRRPYEERRDAINRSSDDMLDLCREVAALRAAASPESVELARRLLDVRLLPVDVGPTGQLVDAIIDILAEYEGRERVKRQPFRFAMDVVKLVDGFIQKQLAGTP